jgi:histidinol-phosphate/aromatic aminotransferase/cobyric acid decarboxylase-like protein
MKAYFDELLEAYPSGLNVINVLGAKLFSLDEANVLVGNGAAELIRALGPVIKGSIGVITPTFNEYAESFRDNDIVYFTPEGFSYDKTDIEKYLKQCDTLVLINPDNPSGNFIKAADIIKILESIKSSGKKIILDESFVDFCESDHDEVLLKQNIIEDNPNLILIRSLSKSFGVPGIRLGLLASGDRELIKKVRANLSIWNINSFGEYFLQIIGKYIKDYRSSCQELIHERNRFKTELEKTGFLHVYPSQANYFLCRIEGHSAEELTEYLLEEHSIFIKDLTGKKGIPGASYIRLAVRDKKDNNIIVEKLKKFINK